MCIKTLNYVYRCSGFRERPFSPSSFFARERIWGQDVFRLAMRMRYAPQDVNSDVTENCLLSTTVLLPRKE